MEHIWSDLDDVLYTKAIKKGDSLDYIKTIIEDGTMTSHKRINTLEKLQALLQDADGPLLLDAMTMEKEELEKRNHDLKNLPHTTEEHYMEQLDQAMRLYAGEEGGEGEDNVWMDCEEEEAASEADEQADDESDFYWHPSFGITYPPTQEYTWARTVWYRTNMAYRLLCKLLASAPPGFKDRFVEFKVMQFINRHLPVVQYLDSLPDPRDDCIDVARLCALYQELGPSTYEDDKDSFRMTRTMVKVKMTPLEILQRDLPLLMWTVEEVSQALQSGVLAYATCIKTEYVEWTPLTADNITPKTHSIYLACIYLLNQCQECLSTEVVELRDALWTYYCSFTDIFYACLPGGRMDDAFLLTPVGSSVSRGGTTNLSENLSPWEMHGSNMDVRAFHAGDLPNLFHVLNSIPLWGEQHTPSYRLGKIYHKALPFACQRRHIIKLIIRTVNEVEAFWPILSKLFWCMLAGLYPGELSGAGAVGMRDLLRIKELTSSKEMLMNAINCSTVPQQAGANGGPLVVFVAFRLHILYMASHNPTYVEFAEKCLDWNYFKKNTIELAAIIRGTSLFPEDPFSQARKQLSKTVKSPHSRVHRLRRRSKAVCLMEHLNEALEKTIIQDKHNRTADLANLREIRMLSSDIVMRLERFKQTMIGFDFIGKNSAHEEEITEANMDSLLERRIKINENALQLYDQVLTVKCKSAILNMLIRIPKEDRLKVVAFSMLMLPEYGGISEKSVQNMCMLCEIYYNNAVPKDIRECIDKMNPPHLVIACFYFNMVALLEKINFVPLDADTVRRIDYAMLHKRYHIYPGQSIPEDVYNVSIALCCEKICNLMGNGRYGDKKVAYDMERQSFVCAYGKSMHAHNKLENDGDEEDDDAEGALGDDEDENDDDVDMTTRVLGAQNDTLDDIMSVLGDLTSDAAKQKGRGTQRTNDMRNRKIIRGERKTFNRVPCGQPIITFSLRGRALIWGNTLENKSQIMHCPECGALHVYTILNFSGAVNGQYRCNECARKEITHLQHRRCAYCNRTGNHIVPEKCKLSVCCLDLPEGLDITLFPEESYQQHYFCRGHYSIARANSHHLPKKELWAYIKDIEAKRMMEHAAK